MTEEKRTPQKEENHQGPEERIDLSVYSAEIMEKNRAALEMLADEETPKDEEDRCS